MGSLANTLFRIMLSWLQGVVSAVWSALTSEKGGSFLEWIGNNWIPIAAVLCIIGLVADLCVYLVRWKPFRVWKSYFSRRKQKDEMIPKESTAQQQNDYVFQSNQSVMKQQEEQPERRREPDLSRWEERSEPMISVEQKELPPPTVTGAGYIVPADSPYRRPEKKTVAAQTGQYLPEQNTESEKEETYTSAPVISRRKRRLNVGDLFSNPEDELYDFDAPQQVIDSRKAYHDPVYPRGWKKGEDVNQ